MSKQSQQEPEATGASNERAVRARTPELAARNERIIALHRSGMEAREIADLIKRSANTVYGVLRRANVPVRRGRDRFDVDGEAIAAAYAAGGTLKGVGRQFGVSRNVVERRVLRHGGKLRSPGRPVSIAEVVRLHKAGADRARIARRLGRDWTTIDRALRDGGITPRNGNYGGYANGTITWHGHGRQNRVKTPTGWHALSKLVWTKAHGAVPPGCIIMRIDTSLPRRDIDNLANLVMMRRGTQTMRVWAGKNVPVPDDPIDRREVLVTILTIAALKAGDTTLKLGTW